MAAVRVFIFLLICWTASAASVDEKYGHITAEGTCPDLWYPYNGYCYKYYECEMEWTMAEAQCLTDSPTAHLASIHSSEENDFVFAFQGGLNNIWIGFNDRAQQYTWEWSDGSPVDYTNWHSGEPNNSCGLLCEENCVEMQVGSEFNDKWNDEDCTTKNRFVCKMEWITGP
ncbi:C-type Lectin CRL-like [Saccoglossus kowalevskii]|uniref:C-type lectin mannose-binding isoform-like n=1 Tax=Saccoglossus kowalevskii TaxID=10224 RepID=A0A0U2STJ3_SACKO|nr:PREDICTED: C-type lectin mannose-binding isoform-like [Saccoglossus kowalevskii]ALR88641.1 lithostathine-like protein253 [Saccoglossus kowalevskii]